MELHTLKDYLVSIRDGFKLIYPTAGLFAEFILRNGRAFPGQRLPSRYRMRMPKLCYFNTYKLVRNSRVLRYCQGYVRCNDLPIPIEHAWAINAKDEVIDVTLGNRGAPREYFGIVFERELAMRQPDPYCGMLTHSNGVPKLDVWLEIDPGFQAVMEEAKRGTPQLP